MSDSSSRRPHDIFIPYSEADEAFVEELKKRLQAIESQINIVIRPVSTLIVSTPGTLGGKPRMAGRRISVQDIAIWHEHMGMSPDEIATNYDLTLAEVYAALAYYHDHREEIEAHIREGRAVVEEMKQRSPSKLAEHRRG
jgi:uncharacterized protein (DUF433 family)